MSNIVHIFDDICLELEYGANPESFTAKLDGPKFIGQGCCKSVGSDCYAYYLVERKQIKSKTIWGISPAKTRFEHDWTDGNQICEGPVSWKAEMWITSWGKTKTGQKKWWFCDEDGNRCKGSRCSFGFKGAYSYRDPSF